MAKRGRPKGSRNNKRLAGADIRRTRCPKCGSTRRSPYTQKRELDATGMDSDGRIYQSVKWRRTQCKKCDQWRDDRELVYE